MIRFEHANDPCVTFEISHTGLSVQEMVQQFRLFLLAIGYHPNSIDEYIKPE